MSCELSLYKLMSRTISSIQSYLKFPSAQIKSPIKVKLLQCLTSIIREYNQCLRGQSEAATGGVPQ